MKKIKSFLAIGLAMIFCCLLSTGCDNKNSDKSDNSTNESTNVSNKGVSIKFSDEFYIDCELTSILISDTNEIYVKPGTTITPKLKKDFKKTLIDSNSDKINFSKSTVYHNICVNNEIISFKDFENYEIVAEDDIVIGLTKSELKPIGVCLYQKTSKNSNWSTTQKSPENINSYLNLENNQISTNDVFLLYAVTLDGSSLTSNSISSIETDTNSNNTVTMNILLEVFMETTKILPTVICRDTKNNFHLIHLDVVTVDFEENNMQSILLLDDMQVNNFNNINSVMITITNNFSSIKK